MRMKLQLGLLLAVIVGLWAAYVVVLAPKVGWFPAGMLGLLGSLFLLLLVSLMVQIVRALARRRLLESVGPPNRDGYQACSGRIVAVGELDRAPLTGTPCLLWEYEFSDGDFESATQWSGIGQAPMAIETEGSRVPIRAGILPEELGWNSIPDATGSERALALAARPELRALEGPLSFGTLLGDLEELLNDDDGAARLDLCRGKRATPRSVSGLRERRLEPNTMVTVLGTYSLTDRAFVPGRRGTELFPKSAKALRSSLLKGLPGALGFALLTNVFLQGIVVLAYFRGGS